MRNKGLHIIFTALAFVVLGCVFWYFRSWNLEIGDGEFVCKVTIGPFPYSITISRSMLSLLLYRWMFEILHPMLNWWVEDIIAISSCVAGLVFFFALYRLVWRSIESPVLRFVALVFPASSLLFNIFCGHIEFYSWTCAWLMVSALFAWKALRQECSLFWPSAAMALAFGFHSSGVFYFPALLVLPFVLQNQTQTSLDFKNRYTPVISFFILFVATALIHRIIAPYFDGELFKINLLLSEPILYFSAQINLLILLAFIALCVYLYHSLVPQNKRQQLQSWWLIYWPWFAVFAVRAYFGLRDEPLLEHLPPITEPYDHGAYLYMAFSWDHLYDKTMFHLWIAPFGLIGFIYFTIRYWKAIYHNGWLLFLWNFSLWALIWTTLFYPQLRTRDWDLFCNMAIPLNLFILYAAINFWSRNFVTKLFLFFTVFQLCISMPTMVRNSGILDDRGYVTVVYAPEPVEAKAYLRGLQLGITPLKQENIRAGEANIRIVPVERGYLSWVQTIELVDGEVYEFTPQLEEAGEAHEIPEFLREAPTD